MARKIEAIANYHCRVGENPLWDQAGQSLYWEDIPTGRLFRLDGRTGRHERFHEGPPVGGFTMQADGSLLLFGTNQIARLAPDGRREVLLEGIDEDMKRFNDVIADPQGRVFAGTIGRDEQRGGLYRVETDGTVRCLFKGTGCSNGMGFSPDRKTFYWTCTTSRRIFRFDYDQATGELSNRRLLIDASGLDGVPDGMTVDAEGNLWSAFWDGAAVCMFSPEGEKMGKIPFSVAKTSSVTFGGSALDELYVTTAGGSDDSEAADGTLYRVEVGARGLGEFCSRILMG